MRVMWAGLLAMAMAACGGRATPPELADRLVAASAANDLAAVQAIVRKPLVVGGLWFSDPTCLTFSAATPIDAPRLPELARCLAGLHLQASPRREPLQDVVVMTYAPGIEVEARFLEDGDGPWLAWIGFEARRDAADGLPTISAATLESLRASGARDGAIDDATGAGLRAHATAFHQPREYASLKLCMDAAGQVTNAHVREASSFAAAAAFSASAKAWTFRPFVAAGQAIPACAVVMMFYPAAEHPATERLPLPVPDAPEDLIFVPSAVLGPRLAGSFAVHPTEAVARAIDETHIGQVTGAFAYCLDLTGAVASIQMLRSTGIPGYDAQIARAVQGWRFAAYREGGPPKRVCSSATFVYKSD